MKSRTRLIAIISGIAAVLVLLVGLTIVTVTIFKLQKSLAPKAPNYTASDLATKAQAQITSGDYKDAQLYLTQALEKDDDHTYRTQLAVIDYQLKQYSDAIAQYQLLIAKNQDVAFSENGIGNADRDWGKAHYADAVTAYQASITADAGYVAAYSNLALLLNSEGNTSQALTVLSNGITATGDQQLVQLKIQLSKP